jgi:lysosomal acid lipase/cholesteryl ester hydrolase
MGKYDVPAVINYVLNATSQSSLYWIGHSVGGQQFFVAMTLYPELNKKVRTMFALAPSVYTGNTTNVFRRVSADLLAPYPAQVIRKNLVNNEEMKL